jgi:hypothetical protein
LWKNDEAFFLGEYLSPKSRPPQTKWCAAIPRSLDGIPDSGTMFTDFAHRLCRCKIVSISFDRGARVTLLREHERVCKERRRVPALLRSRAPGYQENSTTEVVQLSKLDSMDKIRLREYIRNSISREWMVLLYGAHGDSYRDTASI